MCLKKTGYKRQHHTVLKKKMIRSALFRLLSLFGSVMAFFVVQVCFVQSFWLHAMFFPINPRTVSQPTTFTYVGVAGQYFCAPLFLLGALLLLRAAWLLLSIEEGRRDLTKRLHLSAARF